MSCPDGMPSATRTLVTCVPRAGENGAAGTVRAPAGGAVRLREHDSGAGRAFQRWPHTTALALAPLATAPACGRLHARHILHEWLLGHLADDAGLLISEMLTNAISAFRDPVCLRLLADREQLIIEVWDSAPDNPQPRIADYADESGRGMAVIEAIAHRWGVQRISDSKKLVWAELLTAVR
jgi:anti-sigma regulatory factor (Ser/Thr protein kinase)